MAVLYAGAEWAGCHPENFRVGRTDYNPPYATFPVLAIALHHTATTFQGAINTFLAAPASGGNHSAHFAVRNADGYRVQFVDTDDTAFALGYSQPNCYTINIECEQTWDFTNNVKTSDFSDALYTSVGDLVRIVCTDKGVPIDGAHIFGHNHWDTSNTCPYDLDVNRIITLAATPVVVEEPMHPSLKYTLVRMANAAFAGPDHQPTDADITVVGNTIADDGSNVDTVLRAIQADAGSKPWTQIAADLKAGKYSAGKEGPSGPVGPPGPQGPPGIVPVGTHFTGVTQ